MAEVTFIPGIASISGRLGDLVFRTYKKTGKVTVTLMPKNRVAPGGRTASGGRKASTRRQKKAKKEQA